MLNAIVIEHGETTCSVEKGKPCLFLFTKHFGTQPVCHLFDDQPLYEHEDGEKKGWVARCPQCQDLFTFERIVTKEDL